MSDSYMDRVDQCSVCGILPGQHYREWNKPYGWHPWVAPRQEQIKARMIYRREWRQMIQDRRAEQKLEEEA